MKVELTEQQIKKIQNATAITQIQMLMARYVGYMEQMDAKSIWDKLYAQDDPECSIEIGEYGGYDGPEHVKAFFYAYQEYLEEPFDKRGWMDIHNINSPYILISRDGTSAYGCWSSFGPQAKQATPYPSDVRTLTAIWEFSKFIGNFVKIDDEWKIQKLQEVIYIRSPYELGWVRQPDCVRFEPLSKIVPDRAPRMYTYHPNSVYSPTGLYNWGPFPPEPGSF